MYSIISLGCAGSYQWMEFAHPFDSICMEKQTNLAVFSLDADKCDVAENFRKNN